MFSKADNFSWYFARKTGEPLLALAARAGSVQVVRYLISAGADINARTPVNETPLMLAAMAGLGAAFSLQLQRLGRLASWGASGVGLGLFLFFYSQLAGAFAITQSVPAAVAALRAARELS